MADRTITIKLKGDDSQLEKTLKNVESSLNRLQRAQAKLSGGSVNNSQFTQFSTLSKQQLEQVQRLSKERQRLADADLRVLSQKKIAELRVFEATEKSKLRLAEQSAKARTQAENNSFKSSEAAARRNFSEYQRLERDRTRVAQAEARKRSSFSAAKIGGGLQSAGGGLQSVGVGITAGLTAPIAALATLGVSFNAMKETALVSFGVLLKSGEKAKQLFGELQQFAAATPFELPELLGATRSLLAFGVAQEKVVGTLKRIGDIASGVSAPIGEIAEIYGKARVNGRLFAEDVNQLTGRGIPVIQEFAKQFGVTDDKVRQLVEDGKVGFPQLEKAFVDLTAAGGLFAGQTEALSKTFSGQISTLKDAINQGLGDLTAPFFEYLKTVLPEVIKFVGDTVVAFNALSPATQTFIIVAAGVAAAIGPIAVIIGTLIVAIASVITAWATVSAAVVAAGITFSGVGVAIVAVVAVLAAVGVAVYALYQAWEANFGNIQGVVSVFTEMVGAAFNSLLQTIQPAVDAVTEYVQSGFKALTDYWTANGAELNQAAAKTFAALLSAVRVALDAIRTFWQDHGESITAIVSAAFGIIKTLFASAAGFIGNSIKLLGQIINNDWSGAWETVKTIVKDAFNTVNNLIIGAGVLLFNALQAAIELTFSAAAGVLERARQIGSDIGRGMYEGLNTWLNPISSLSTYISNKAIEAISNAAEVKSPSRKTIAIGSFIGEGLALGIEAKTSRVTSAAKKIADETIKQLAEAVKSFDKLAGASPEAVGRIQQTNRISDATGSQSEIIKLRDELKINNFKPLPSTLGATEAELIFLQSKKKAADEFNASLEKMAEISKTVAEFEENAAKEFADRLKEMRDSGAVDVINLQKEIALLGVTNDLDRQRVENIYELKLLREEMANDGYGEAQITEAAQLLRIEQGRRFELQQILNVRRQAAEAGNLEKSLLGDLTQAQNGNRELSEYEKTLAKIGADLKDIAPAEKERLLNIAKQVDGQKQFNEQYKQTYGFIRDSFDILTEKGVSFGDKLKSIFGGIADKFKKMLLDMAASFLTNKITGGGGSAGGRVSRTLARRV